VARGLLDDEEVRVGPGGLEEVGQKRWYQQTGIFLRQGIFTETSEDDADRNEGWITSDSLVRDTFPFPKTAQRLDIGTKGGPFEPSEPVIQSEACALLHIFKLLSCMTYAYQTFSTSQRHLPSLTCQRLPLGVTPVRITILSTPNCYTPHLRKKKQTRNLSKKKENSLGSFKPHPLFPNYPIALSARLSNRLRHTHRTGNAQRGT